MTKERLDRIRKSVSMVSGKWLKFHVNTEVYELAVVKFYTSRSTTTFAFVNLTANNVLLMHLLFKQCCISSTIS